MIRIYHGIYQNGTAYTRKSVFAVELYTKNPQIYKKRELKRIKKAEIDKLKGKYISEEQLLFNEPMLNEIDISQQFDELLEHKSRLITAIPEIVVDYIPKHVANALRKLSRRVEFTIAESEGIAAISIVHPLDHFDRKKGSEEATKKLMKALRILDKHGHELEDKCIDYDW